MDIFTNGESKFYEQLERSDVLNFTERLEVFLKLYNEYVYTSDPEQTKALQELSQILSILKMERYDLLVADPSIIHNDLQKQYPMFNQRLQAMLNDQEFPF